MLSLGKLGAGPDAAQYYLRRKAGCELEYYTGAGERPGRWAGAGAAALGLSGVLDARGEAGLRAVLEGRCPVSGVPLVGPVLRADPRSRVPAAPVLAALTAAAAARSCDLARLGLAERDLAAVVGAAERVQRARRRPVWPEVSLPAEVAGRVLTVVGADPVAVLRSARGRDRFGSALRRSAARVDRRVPGVDVTLSAPKSVSVLFGLGAPAVAEAVRAAHETAVAEALAYVESGCATGLRGHHRGAGQRVATSGLIGVAFEHRSSRELDPQLHTHVVVANLARGVDGRWGAIDTRALYRHARTGGYIYQAVLRGELTARLGVRWTAVSRGSAELEGVPAGLLRLFSARRRAIEAELERTGGSGPRAAQAATLATRPAKADEPALGLRAVWAQRAAAAGFDPARVVGRVLRPGAAPALPAARELAARVLSAEGLTRDRASFDRRDLLRAVCEALPPGVALRLPLLRAFATAVVRDPEVVPLLPTAGVEERRYSTRELLAAEQATLDAALARAGDGVAVVPEAVVAAAITDAGLGGEHAALVRALTTSGSGVQVVVGPAGAGKTRALAAAAAAWAAVGVPVRGAAMAAIAARVLEFGAGIPSSSLTRLQARLARETATAGQAALLPAGGVLVVDEAGMVGTRALRELIATTAARGVKLVLVGDPHQLPELQAGGMFAALAAHAPTVALRGNQRQVQAWERAALDELRHGDVLAAVNAWRSHDRVALAEDSTDLLRRLGGDVARARAGRPPGEVLAVTATRAEARQVNAAVRAVLLATGQLGDTAVTDPQTGVEWRAGDDVVLTVNDYALGLLNGTRGRIAAVDPDAGAVTVRVEDGRELALPRGYLAGGRLAHGYAVTAHRAQGSTVDECFVWGGPALTREAGYVAMSRGRVANHLYLAQEPGPDGVGDACAGRPVVVSATRDARGEFTHAAAVARLERSARQRLAMSWLPTSRAAGDRGR